MTRRHARLYTARKGEKQKGEGNIRGKRRGESVRRRRDIGKRRREEYRREGR